MSRNKIIFIMVFILLLVVFLHSCSGNDLCPRVWNDPYFNSLLYNELKIADSVIRANKEKGKRIYRWGEYNEHGKEEGLWFYTHADGETIESIGYYKNGYKSGIWLYYRENGKLWYVLNHLAEWGRKGDCFSHGYLFDRDGRDSEYVICSPYGMAIAWMRFKNDKVTEAVKVDGSMSIFFSDRRFSKIVNDTQIQVMNSQLIVNIYPPRPRCFEVEGYIKLEGYTDWDKLDLEEDPYVPAKFEVTLDSVGTFRLIKRLSLRSEFYDFKIENAFDTVWIIVVPDKDSLERLYRSIIEKESNNKILNE